MLKEKDYEKIIDILKEELVPAAGCTEPIAIAFGAAVARIVLGGFPESINVKCSGNLIKNVKGVVVPNSGNLKGIKASAIMGIVCGDPDKKMEVIDNATDKDRALVKQLLEDNYCSVDYLPGDATLKLVITAKLKDNYSQVTIMHSHTNIVKIEKNGEILFERNCDEKDFTSVFRNRTILSIKNIMEFAQTVEIGKIASFIKRQIDLNIKIAKEGLSGKYGIGIGKMLISSKDVDVFTKAKAFAAAGSEARMSGCSKAVIINSGSGNQGITTSVPVIIYTREMGYNDEKLYRALLISNLIAIRLKSRTGRLSALCGAIGAACGAGCALTYLSGGNIMQIEETIMNTLGNVFGIVCDGAKPSCALKITSVLDAAFMAHELSMHSKVLDINTGILRENIEKTIDSLDKIAIKGMKETDNIIIQQMMKS